MIPRDTAGTEQVSEFPPRCPPSLLREDNLRGLTDQFTDEFAGGLLSINALPGGRAEASGIASLPTLAQDADFEEVFIDSSIVRAHQHAAGAPKKRETKRSGDHAAD